MINLISDHPEFDPDAPERFDWSRAASLDVSDCACQIKDAIKIRAQKFEPPFGTIVMDAQHVMVMGLREALNIIAACEPVREVVEVSLVPLVR